MVVAKGSRGEGLSWTKTTHTEVWWVLHLLAGERTGDSWGGERRERIQETKTKHTKVWRVLHLLAGEMTGDS